MGKFSTYNVSRNSRIAVEATHKQESNTTMPPAIPIPFDLIKFITPYLSIQTLATVMVVVAVFKARDSAIKFIAHMEQGMAAMRVENAIMKKRQDKLLLIVVACPSVPKENVAWLRDDAKNSNPPSKSLCDRRCGDYRDEGR